MHFDLNAFYSTPVTPQTTKYRQRMTAGYYYEARAKLAMAIGSLIAAILQLVLITGVFAAKAAEVTQSMGSSLGAFGIGFAIAADLIYIGYFPSIVRHYQHIMDRALGMAE